MLHSHFNPVSIIFIYLLSLCYIIITIIIIIYWIIFILKRLYLEYYINTL